MDKYLSKILCMQSRLVHCIPSMPRISPASMLLEILSKHPRYFMVELLETSEGVGQCIWWELDLSYRQVHNVIKNNLASSELSLAMLRSPFFP